MQPFAYIKPATVDAAIAALSGGNARVLAGGSDLLPQLREGRRALGTVVDLKAIAELTRLSRFADGGWTIGAATTVGALGRNEVFAREHKALLAAARLIGSLQIQNRASLGGNLCNAAPSADAVPLLHCLEAELEVAGAGGRRRMPVASLAVAPGKTRLAADEILVAIHLPPMQPRSAAAYLRFTPRREMDIAVAGAACALTLDTAGAIASARITLASVAPVPLDVPRAAQALHGKRPSRAAFEAAGAIAAADCTPISDSRGSADYRRHLVGVLTARALAAATADLGVALS